MSILPVSFRIPSLEEAIDLDMGDDLDLIAPAPPMEDRVAYHRFSALVAQLGALNLEVDASEVQAQAPDIVYPSEVTIDVVFLPFEARHNVSEVFALTGPDAPLGFHAQTTGDGLLGGDDCFFNDRHQVVVFVPSNQDLETFLSAHMDDLDLSREAAETDFYNTLTHEVSHVLLFAEASGGLSSYDIDVCFDAGDFPFDRHAVTTGCELSRLADHYADCQDEQDATEAMEQLVEDQGHALLQRATASTRAKPKPF